MSTKQEGPKLRLDPTETLRVLSEMQQLMLTDPARLAALSQEAVTYAAQETGRSPEDVERLASALDLETASEEDRHAFLVYFSRMASTF